MLTGKRARAVYLRRGSRFLRLKSGYHARAPTNTTPAAERCFRMSWAGQLGACVDGQSRMWAITSVRVGVRRCVLSRVRCASPDTDKYAHEQTDRHTDRKSVSQTDSETGRVRQTDRQTDRPRQTESDRQAGRQPGSRTDGQTDRREFSLPWSYQRAHTSSRAFEVQQSNPIRCCRYTDGPLLTHIC